MTRKEFFSLECGTVFVGAIGYSPHAQKHSMFKSALYPDCIRVIVDGDWKKYHYRSIALPKTC